jgi:hypothetical protein
VVGPNHAGYTTHLTCAGIYSESEAKEIERNANPRAGSSRQAPYEKAWTLIDALGCERRHGHSHGVTAGDLFRASVSGAEPSTTQDANEEVRQMVDARSVRAAMVECRQCDGCGWYEGGKTLKTNCHECGGTGRVPA